jgi:UDP-N-acetylmuramoyl-tripeptide--D-alanyl-D-alanine ligase
MDATALPTIAAACGGVLLGGTAEITAISKDTRTLRSGDLYWALVGENFDGHEFAGAAG